MEVLRSMFNEDDVGSVIPTSRTDKNRDERKDFKDNGKRQSGVRICLALGLYVVLHICHRYTRVLYLKRSEINLFYIWINSGLVMILIGFYNRYRYQRRLSFLLHTRPLKTHPEISLYALFVAVDGTHSNGFYNTSGGKEVHQLGMAISPLCVIMAALWFRPDGGHTSKIRGAIAMCSILMLILFSAEYDVYIPYHVTVMTAIWAILHGSLLAGFALMAKYYLHEMSLSQIIHSMNLSCVVLLPVVMVLTGELSLLLTGTLPGQRNTIVPVYGIIVMAILQLLNQIASLHLVNVTSPLHYLASRGLAWVPVTLIITFGFRIEMLISTFKGFFIAVGVFLMSLVEELRKPKL